MARNKAPQETVNKIMRAATKLFLEKGYENTSMQDILNELDGLTKGAVYYHFPSKEELFDAVAYQFGRQNEALLSKAAKSTDLNGAQKLQNLVCLMTASAATKSILQTAPCLLDNPRLLAVQLRQIQQQIAPQYLAPFVHEGVQDGSIQTDSPCELAELLAVLLNIWLNPLIFQAQPEQMRAKCTMVNACTLQYGFALLNEEAVSHMTCLISCEKNALD